MRWVLATHVIAVISWMAGQLYLWRLFVYHAMEQEAVVRARLEVMERRLLRAITTPAMLLALATGLSMLWANADYLLHQPWMHAKLLFVALLLGSHGHAARVRQRLVAHPRAYDHRLLRMLNELPTVLMVGIVIAVIVRPFARQLEVRVMRLNPFEDHPAADGALGMLLACHARIRSFSALAERLADARDASTEAISETASALVRYFGTAFPLHARDEDELLRPLLHERALGSAAIEVLGRLEWEHGELDGRLGLLMPMWKRLIGYPGELASMREALARLSSTFRADLLAHLEAEERFLFPAVRRLLSRDEDTELAIAMRERRAHPLKAANG